MNEVYNREMYETAFQEALQMVDKNLDYFVEQYPQEIGRAHV